MVRLALGAGAGAGAGPPTFSPAAAVTGADDLVPDVVDLVVDLVLELARRFGAGPAAAAAARPFAAGAGSLLATVVRGAGARRGLDSVSCCRWMAEASRSAIMRGPGLLAPQSSHVT